MKISIDLDGVVYCFTHQITGIANSLWPGRLPEGHEPKDYGYSGDLSKDDWEQVWAKIKTDPTFYERGPAYEENIQALRVFLSNQSGHEIYFVTSRQDTGGVSVALQTRRWLHKQGVLGLYASGNYLAVIPVASPEVKKFIMTDMDIHFSIDDMGSTVEACNAVKGHKAVLLSRPWNQERNYGRRVASLAEYFDIILGKEAYATQ